MPADLLTPAGTEAGLDAVQYCTFWVDELYLGIDALTVQEVLRNPGLTPVPLAPPAVRGLINLRGQIVTAIDLGARLGRTPTARRMNVVVRTADGSASLLVDKIADVVQVPRSGHEAVPTTLTGVARDLLRATCPLEDSLLLILDVARVTAFRKDG
ncbi:chemotaxis protein CheW [Aquipuribacter hungaricus]|uniref:Chemotaxis protein CheW n=1 Tax=Aquipuribacter hungaricus TaxID=545624 RepID=A0ABV7WGK3_9MICO